MPFAFDKDSKQITMAAGDTAVFEITINWDRLKDGDAVIFAVFGKDGGADILRKVMTVEAGKVRVRLCNHDTRDLDAGRYRWNLRIVTDPEYDADGNVVAEDCEDDVVTVFNNPPGFTLKKGGGYV